MALASRGRFDWKLNLLVSETWKQVFEKYEEYIPNSLRRTILDKCYEIEIRLWDWHIYDIGQELRNKYEDFGTKLISRKETPDWKNVSENLSQMYDEYSRKWEERRSLDLVRYLSRFTERRMRMFKDSDSMLSLDEETIPKQRTVNSVSVEDINGKKHMFDGVTSADSVETLMNRIEQQTKIPKHKCVLICNGRRLEDKAMLHNYDIDTSTILLLRQKQKGEGTNRSFDVRQIVLNKFNHYYKKIQNLVSNCPQFFEDTTRMLSEKDFSRIAKTIGDGWQSLGFELGLDKISLEHIMDNNKTLEMKIVDMLTKWSHQKPQEAKAGSLYSAIKNCAELSCNLEKIQRIILGI